MNVNNNKNILDINYLVELVSCPNPIPKSWLRYLSQPHNKILLLVTLLLQTACIFFLTYLLYNIQLSYDLCGISVQYFSWEPTYITTL